MSTINHSFLSCPCKRGFFCTFPCSQSVYWFSQNLLASWAILVSFEDDVKNSFQFFIHLFLNSKSDAYYIVVCRQYLVRKEDDKYSLGCDFFYLINT